ncbi:deoxynucleotidyltransferase terminal-interacting protein 2-like [Zerene cesonia]|uniref:deoxynucleotidyltransferase terminal-interacting protein 2-like n=1 Tax=Zerene cesonia TaxID=33412 RepID=UPI0018E4F826|nr:deoxynucleotidyltransferase terminal-interacting protein 2-like [Zerene cesonia]XP_038209161.1 deoxynucleotidyltransferase terminal-interacting protein 2-like [Zerene cesonia]
MDFIVDTVGDEDLQDKAELLKKDEKLFIDKEKKTEAILDLFDKKKAELDEQLAREEAVENKLKNLKIDGLFDDFFNDMMWTNSLLTVKKAKPVLFQFNQLDKETGKLKSKIGSVDVEKEMKKSVLQPGIEKEHSLPKYNVSEKKLRSLRKQERLKTKGPGWFNMPAPEITPELKNDLRLLKMRSALDPKRFYKKNDMEVLPKYFQVGRIMDSPLDHVNERLTRKERKRTMVDELLADAQLQKYNKKKYKEIIDEKRKTQYKTFMKDKRKKNKAELKKSKAKSKQSK